MLLLICSLIFAGYVIHKCGIECNRRNFQTEEKRTGNDLKKAAKGPLAPKKGENCDLIDGIVNDTVGPTKTSRSQDMASGPPPPPPPSTTVKDHLQRMVSRQRIRENDLESGQGTLSGGSRAMTKFAANTLFMGMKDRNHGEKFKQLVRKLIEEADKVHPQENVDSNHAPPAGQNQANHEPPPYQETVNPAYERVGTVTVTVHEDVDNKDDAELDKQTAAV